MTARSSVAPLVVAPPRVLSVDPRTDPHWDVLSRGELGSVFTAPPWIRAFCDTYGFVPQARVAVAADGSPLGGLAWTPLHDLRGKRLSSLPFSERADPLVGDAATWAALADHALAPELPFTLRCLDDSVAVDDPRLRRVGEAAWHGTVVGCPADEVDGLISSSARNTVRAAKRNGVRVEASTGVEAIREFHRMHVTLRRTKYRLLAQPLELFERIHSAFATFDGVVTLLAYVDGEPAAGAVCLVWNDVLYYKFSASRSEFLSLRPNDLIGWATLRLAADRGLRMVDWGLSDLDQPGLIAYKRKWGSVERRILTLRAGDSPAVDGAPDAGEMLARLTELLTDDGVPEEITTRAGALLYRYFC